MTTHIHWEDRLTTEQHEEMSAAMDKFRAGGKKRKAQHILYEVLTNMGVTSEEADEIINLEMNQ